MFGAMINSYLVRRWKKKYIFYFIKMDLLLYWSCKLYFNHFNANHYLPNDFHRPIFTWRNMRYVPYDSTCNDKRPLSTIIKTYTWIILQFSSYLSNYHLLFYRSYIRNKKHPTLLANSICHSWSNSIHTNYIDILFCTRHSWRLNLKRTNIKSLRKHTEIIFIGTCRFNSKAIPKRL